MKIKNTTQECVICVFEDAEAEEYTEVSHVSEQLMACLGKKLAMIEQELLASDGNDGILCLSHILNRHG